MPQGFPAEKALGDRVVDGQVMGGMSGGVQGLKAGAAGQGISSSVPVGATVSSSTLSSEAKAELPARSRIPTSTARVPSDPGIVSDQENSRSLAVGVAVTGVPPRESVG